MFTSISLPCPFSSIFSLTLFPSSLSALFPLVFPEASHQVGVGHHCSSGVAVPCPPASCWVSKSRMSVLTPPVPRKQRDAGRGMRVGFVPGRNPGGCWGSGRISVLLQYLQPLSSSKAMVWKPPHSPCKQQVSATGKPSRCSGILYVWMQSTPAPRPISYQKS